MTKPNGNLGRYVIPALVAVGIEVTVITRHIEKASELKDSLIRTKTISADACLTIQEGDYKSAKTLASVLKSHDSVVSLLNRDQTAAQIIVIDATILAGVAHIIPAAFGVDSRLPEIRALPHLAAGYIKSEEHMLRAIEESGGKTTYTLIHNGGFLEWMFDYDLFVNLSGKGDKQSTLFDSGDVHLSVSSMPDIGKAVATAVRNRRDERFKNKFLLMHNMTISQNEVLRLAKEILPDKPWPVTRIDTREAQRKSQEAFDASVASGVKAPASAYHGFILRAFYGLGLGLFPKVDNELLGVEERDTAWLRGILERYLVA